MMCAKTWKSACSNRRERPAIFPWKVPRSSDLCWKPITRCFLHGPSLHRGTSCDKGQVWAALPMFFHATSANVGPHILLWRPWMQSVFLTFPIDVVRMRSFGSFGANILAAQIGRGLWPETKRCPFYSRPRSIYHWRARLRAPAAGARQPRRFPLISQLPEIGDWWSRPVSALLPPCQSTTRPSGKPRNALPGSTRIRRHRTAHYY